MLQRAACFLFGVLQLVLLTGCAPAPLEAAEIQFSFCCTAECRAGGVEAVVLLERPGLEMLRCVVQSPEDLAGMEYHWDGRAFTMTWANLCGKSENCPLPENHFARILKDILEYASRKDVLTPGEGDSFTGECNGDPFTIYVDRTTGRIGGISVPQRNFSASLYAYTQINGNPV